MSPSNGIKSPRAFALVGLVAGLLFGAGLVIGGMTLPEKVRGFLDFTGSWDPTLAFVMGGAVVVHSVAYWLVKRRPSPMLADAFQIPTRKDIDAKLVLGAAVFGLGWGVGGYCPGPAITSLPVGGTSVAVFVVAMLASSWATGLIEARLGTSGAPPVARPTRKPTDPEPTR
ncbi:MAG: DUF6691 family protein [Deltaproteobacteria bacterium]